MNPNVCPRGTVIPLLDASMDDCVEAAWLTVLEQLCVEALGTLPGNYRTVEIPGVWNLIISSH